MKKAPLVFLALILFCANPALSQNRRVYGNQSGNYNPNLSPNLNPFGAGGVPSQGSSPYYGPYNQYGAYPYANQPGYGYYGANPVAPAYPAYGAPVPVNGGLFRFNVGGFSGSYWKAPSGYYYPWGAGAYLAPAPVIIVEQGVSQQAQPPVADMLRDMSSYIEDQNGKKKFKPEDYQHLSRRVKDLMSLDSTMRTRNGGTLDPSDEEKMRRDTAALSGDISRRVLP